MQICIARAHSQHFQIEQMQDQAFVRAQGLFPRAQHPQLWTDFQYAKDIFRDFHDS